MIKDCSYSFEECMAGTTAPNEFIASQRLLDVIYFDFQGIEKIGQIVVNEALTEEILAIFAVIRQCRFPLQSVIPVHHFSWSDDRSMEANNSSAFNYRFAVGKSKLSQHSYGTAVDLNPAQNPYIRGELILPPGAAYNPAIPGTLTEESPVVQAFLERGWTWGGQWSSLKDWHHFEKPLG